MSTVYVIVRGYILEVSDAGVRLVDSALQDLGPAKEAENFEAMLEDASDGDIVFTVKR